MATRMGSASFDEENEDDSEDSLFVLLIKIFDFLTQCTPVFFEKHG